MILDEPAPLRYVADVRTPGLPSMTVDDFDAVVASYSWARLYHAVQLRDLRSYVQTGRILSRSELFARGAEFYTPFDSDYHDIAEHCEHDVFGNLVDQAVASKNGKWIPNIYGPITFVFEVPAVRNGNNREIVVRRGGIFSGDSEGKRPLSPAEVSEMLRERGGSREFQLVEGTLLLKDLLYVLVAPVVIDGRALVDLTTQALQPIAAARGNRVAVIERDDLSQAWRERYRDLITWSADARRHGGSAAFLPQGLDEWYQALNGNTKERNLRRFATYLLHGTISAARGLPGYLPERYDPPVDDVAEEAIEPDPQTEIPSDEIYDRAYIIWKADQAYESLIAAIGVDDEGASEHWTSLQAAINDLNEWIDGVRSSILSDEEEYRIWYPDGHDRAMSHELVEWASHFSEIPELPDFFLEDADIPEPYWRNVKEYPTSIYEL